MSQQLETMTPEQKIVDLTMASAAMQEKAAAVLHRDGDVKAACAALIPGVVRTMVDNQRIEPTEAEKLASQLGDPVWVLQCLEKVARHRNDAELAVEQLGLGRPSGPPAVKTAQARPRYLGDRVTVQADSDRQLLAALGIA